MPSNTLCFISFSQQDRTIQLSHSVSSPSQPAPAMISLTGQQQQTPSSQQPPPPSQNQPETDHNQVVCHRKRGWHFSQKPRKWPKWPIQNKNSHSVFDLNKKKTKKNFYVNKSKLQLLGCEGGLFLLPPFGLIHSLSLILKQQPLVLKEYEPLSYDYGIINYQLSL